MQLLERRLHSSKKWWQVQKTQTLEQINIGCVTKSFTVIEKGYKLYRYLDAIGKLEYLTQK